MDNMKDGSLRDRMGSSKKITNRQAVEIRHRRAAGETTAMLAKEFGVSDGTIRQIVRRNIHKYAEEALSEL